ncbi:hypothetical protein [Sedimentitalea sp.]|uniref:hypothetical protein n=1 Tax=Sedimentitalea sp. TaxID=2048915 RepID=UPI003299525F
MPNSFAYLIFYSWPLVAYIIFRKQPLVPALVWSIVLGYILLPSRVGLDLPAFPAIGKFEITSISAAIMCFIAAREDGRSKRWEAPPATQNGAKPRRSRLVWIVRILLLTIIISPLLTVLNNPDPIVAGPVIINGLRLYDGFSVIGAAVFMILPFVLGHRFLNTTESHVILLKVMCYAMLGYSLLALWEVRMSPQLNRMIYGFFPHSFLQHMRSDGFRPLVFFGHGLSLGIFLSMSVLSTIALWRHLKDGAAKATVWLVFIGWLLLILVLSKNVGALMITLALMPFAILMRARGQLIFAATLSTVVLLYPMLRGAGYVPTDEIHAFVLERDAERAQSLKFRLDNEDSLLEKASQKPVSGWGTWGRNHVYDEDTGRSLSVTDGMWVIIIGVFGWLGYIARFGLLTIPIILLALSRRRLDIGVATSGLSLVLSANLVDLLPNAALSPVTWLLAGALMGRCAHASETTLQARKDQRPIAGVKDQVPIPTVESPVMTRKHRAGTSSPPVSETTASETYPVLEKPFLKKRKKRQGR